MVVTEFGMRTYAGAHSSGSLGFGIVDGKSQPYHQLPLIGRFVRPRLTKWVHVRDEPLQTSELRETRGILDSAGVDGAFVCSFSDSIGPFDEVAQYDLDMPSMSLVKTLRRGHGTTYPDMPWEPKQSFKAVADFYGETAGAVTS